MNCIIDQCYVCQSPINFTTYIFLYVMPLLTIRLAYDIFHLFPLFLLEHESKETKLKLLFIIYLAHNYIERKITKQALEYRSN